MLQYLDTIIAFVVILLGVSLFITILTQMISTLLGYRGTNLLWGIKTLMGVIEPELETKAEQLATKVLTHPVISDSILSKFEDGSLLGKLTKRWRLATAISPEELAHSLRNYADDIRAGDVKMATLIDGIFKKAENIDPEAKRKAQMFGEVFKALGSNYAIQADRLVQQVGTSLKGSVGKLEAWFDMVMKRTSQRFALQMRIWTIIFAIVIAFGTQLDSFKIVDQLWTSPELRASLVSDKDTILKEASAVLSAQSGTAQVTGPGVPPQILGDAMKNLMSMEKEAAAGLSAPPEFKNLDGAIDWLKNLKGDQKKLAGEYRNLVIAELSAHAKTIEQELAKGGFQLQIVKWQEFRSLFLYDGLRRLLGILVTAGLLSLGAPFWFNILKSLSNLRPLVANSSGKTVTEPTES